MVQKLFRRTLIAVLLLAMLFWLLPAPPAVRKGGISAPAGSELVWEALSRQLGSGMTEY